MYMEGMMLKQTSMPQIADFHVFYDFYIYLSHLRGLLLQKGCMQTFGETIVWLQNHCLAKELARRKKWTM